MAKVLPPEVLENPDALGIRVFYYNLTAPVSQGHIPRLLDLRPCFRQTGAGQSAPHTLRRHFALRQAPESGFGDMGSRKIDLIISAL